MEIFKIINWHKRKSLRKKHNIYWAIFNSIYRNYCNLVEKFKSGPYLQAHLKVLKVYLTYFIPE